MTGPGAVRADIPGLRTRSLGRSAERHASIASTNDLALDRADAGAPNGHVVLADHQTAGRGRRGRAWSAAPGRSILASVVVRPGRGATFDSPAPSVAAAGLAIAEALEAATGLAAGIKWPNDVWIAGRKAAGVLAEARGLRADEPVFVIGFGVNVLQGAAEFPPELRGTATSVAAELTRRDGSARAPDLPRLLAAILDALERRLDEALLPPPRPALEAAYRARSVLLGRRVALLDGDDPVEGVVADLSAADGLVLRTADGSVRHVRAEHASDVRPI